MGHLEGNFTPVLYIGRKVPKGQGAALSLLHQGTGTEIECLASRCEHLNSR